MESTDFCLMVDAAFMFLLVGGKSVFVKGNKSSKCLNGITTKAAWEEGARNERSWQQLHCKSSTKDFFVGYWEISYYSPSMKGGWRMLLSSPKKAHRFLFFPSRTNPTDHRHSQPATEDEYNNEFAGFSTIEINLQTKAQETSIWIVLVLWCFQLFLD